MNISIRVQQLSHEVRNFEANDKVIATGFANYSSKRRSNGQLLGQE